MDKESIKNVLNAMADGFKKDEVDLYKKLIGDIKIENIDNVRSFHLGLIYPYGKFIRGLISCEISKNEDVQFILASSDFVEHHFEYWIERVDGTSCCADKTRTILNKLVDFYKNGTKIEFDYTQEYTFHLPKNVFTTHEDIVGFYEGVRLLHFGNPIKYLNEIKKMAEIISRINYEKQ